MKFVRKNISTVWTLIKINLFKNIKEPISNLPIFFFPVIELLLFGYLNQAITQDDNLKKIFFTGALLLVIVFRSQQEITGPVLDEVYNNNFKNIFSSPVTINQYILAQIISSLIKLLVSMVIYVILAYLVFQFNFFQLSKYSLLVIINFTIFGWTLGVISSAFILCFGSKMSFLSWITSMILSPFIAVFYPREVIKFPFSLIANLLPTPYLFEILKDDKIIRVQDVTIGMSLNIIYFILGYLILIWLFHRALKRGTFYSL